jgi:hypothetical protein
MTRVLLCRSPACRDVLYRQAQAARSAIEVIGTRLHDINEEVDDARGLLHHVAALAAERAHATEG